LKTVKAPNILLPYLILIHFGRSRFFLLAIDWIKKHL